jgi:hypothetical protein
MLSDELSAAQQHDEAVVRGEQQDDEEDFNNLHQANLLRHKRFFASKSTARDENGKLSLPDWKSTGNSPPRRRKRTAAKSVVVHHLRSNATDHFTKKELTGIPVAFAMRLNDETQAKRAMMLLKQENKKEAKKHAFDGIKKPESANPTSYEQLLSNKRGSSRSKSPTLWTNEPPVSKSKSATRRPPTTRPSTSSGMPVPGVEAEPNAPVTATDKLSSTKQSTGGYPLVYEGPPDRKPGVVFPPGWIQRTYKRPGTSPRVRVDHYWFSPVTQKKLRSIVEVQRFLKALEENGGDEYDAWSKTKTKRQLSTST